MLTIKEIASALLTTRTEFGKLFWNAQSVVIPDPALRVEFEAIAHNEPDVRAAFELALQHASNKGFLTIFMGVAVDAHMENGAIAHYLIQQASGQPAANADLHAMANPPAGFADPHIFCRGLMGSLNHTGKVLINGVACGTGVLVGQNLFLTAWHVVKDMFDPILTNGQPDGFQPKQNPPALQVEFGNVLSIVGVNMRVNGSTIVNAHQNWLVHFSACHPLELNKKIPPKLDDLDAYCDYAIIRLAKTIGLERRWTQPNPNTTTPAPQSNIVLLQHPAGAPMKMDYSQIVDLNPADPAIPRVRFLHKVNALPGSSGGPCYDKEFSLVGIHQGSWPSQVNGSVVNRGVPLKKIIADYSSSIGELPLPDPADCPVWCIDKKEFKPFIGYDEMQADVWSFIQNGSRRILYTAGEGKSGKSYLFDLVFAILDDASHLKLTLKAEAISKLDVLQIVNLICSLAGTAVPVIDRLEDYNATVATWLKDEVMVKLMETLESRRGGRKVWIQLSELNHVDITGTHASEFLFLLYEQVNQNKWLYILLDGMRAAFPENLAPVVKKYSTRPLTEDDIRNYFQRGVSERGATPDNQVLHAFIKQIFKKYQKELVTAPASALGNLADFCQGFILDL